MRQAVLKEVHMIDQGKLERKYTGMKRLIKSLLLAAAFTFSPPLADAINANFISGEVFAKTKSVNAAVIVTAAAYRYGVPPSFALRIARQESGVQCGRWGDHGRSGGPLQIYWPSARMMFGVRSFKTFRQMSCASLTDLGMRHLKAAYRSARGNLWLAALKHNGGVGAGPRNHMARNYANAVMGKNRKHKTHVQSR
jgi:hypothetical protein